VCIDGGGDRGRGMDSFGVNLGHPIVTNGNFASQLFSNYLGQDFCKYTVIIDIDLPVII